MTKPQGTSKAGEMDWEEFDSRFNNGLFEERRNADWIAKNLPKYDWFEITDEVKDFIRTAIQQAIAQERERIAEGIKGINPKMPDECSDIIDVYDDYTIGYSEAKLDALNIITNNHE